MPKLTNRDCATYVGALKPFKNGKGTIYGDWSYPNTYVVYSYGAHFPIYVWVRQTNRWYANEDKYSRTTTNHQRIAHPSQPTTPVSTKFIRSLAIQGFAAIARARVVYGEVI